MDSGSRIKDHFVPCNETSGLILGVQSVASFIMNQYDNLASRIKSKLTVSFQIDSSCLGSWLSPYIVNKNVFVKNSSSKIHDLCTDISRDYDLEVNFSHVAGVGNIADFNSKTQDGVNPVELTNTAEWRHGNPAFCQDVFPQEDMVFLKYVDGDMVKYTQPKVDQNLVSTISCCNDETSQVTPVTFGHFSIASQELKMEDMIRYLPILSEDQYQNFIANKSLVQTIRL